MMSVYYLDAIYKFFTNIMASNSTISISFKISDGADGLKKLTVDAEALRKVMKETVDISIGLKKNIINFAALCTGIDSVSNSFNNLQECFVCSSWE